MFPIRPCADAVRSGISVLWSSASLLYSTNNGFFTSRILIRQFQCSRSNVFASSYVTCNNNNAKKLTSSTNQSPISSPPPALNQILRGGEEGQSTSGHDKCRNSLLLQAEEEIITKVISESAKFAATPKGKERESEADHHQLKTRQQSGDGGGSSSQNPSSDKPGPDQLLTTYNTLQKSLERTFTHPMDYRIYHSDILFIDNIRHIRTQGLPKYVQQVALLRTVGHLKFAFVRFEIVNMSMSQEEARITVRWRIRGLSGIRVMLKFWKYKLWKWQEIMNHQETWYDGISYFDVGADGLIFQHVADKVMENKDRSLDEKPASGSNIPFAAKLGALGATAFPTPSLSYSRNSSTLPGVANDNGNISRIAPVAKSLSSSS